MLGGIEIAHAAEEGISIHLAPTAIGSVFGVPVTNTLFTVWLTMAVLLLLTFLVRRKLMLIPGRLQLMFELIIGGVYDYMAEVLGREDYARKFFPVVMTIFLFILLMNWVGLLPGIDSIGFYPDQATHATIEEGHVDTSHVASFIPFFHPAATDLNITIAFAIVAFLTIEFAGVVLLGLWKYGGKFINFRSPIGFVIGIIELISELARLISFSFRLFGNIFAGKTLIVITMFFVPYILPVPLLAFEAFVGFIQAFIFAILTLFFIKIAIEEPH